MLFLAASDTLAGVASAASKVTCTISGDEVNTSTGTDAGKVLYQGQLASSAATIYTVPATTVTVVKTIMVVNTDSVSRTFQLFRGGTAAANAIIGTITLPANHTAVFDGAGWHVLSDQGQLLSVGATGATGDPGADGVGIPVGGSAAQRLAKVDATDYNTEWVTSSDAITEITTIPTAEMDDTLVLAPVGDGTVAFRAEAGGSGGVLIYSTAIPTMTSATAPSGTASDSEHYGSTPAWQAMGGAYNGWLTNGSALPQRIGYQFATAKTALAYGIRPWFVDNYPVRTPTAWEFQGSNDGFSTHDVLDSVTGWSPPSPSFEFVWTIASPASYTSYRLVISANGGDVYTGVGRFVIYAEEDPCSPFLGLNGMPTPPAG
jgi:hypothetical protein